MHENHTQETIVKKRRVYAKSQSAKRIRQINDICKISAFSAEAGRKLYITPSWLGIRSALFGHYKPRMRLG